MNKKQKSSIIIASLASIVIAGSLIAGSMYALFTSESKTNIAVTSGKVDVTATISDLKTYSGVNLIGEPDSDELEETAEGKFTNGGTAKIEGNTLKLDKITPGDKATFNITITNYSNVNTKYRTIIEKTSSSDSTLYDALKFNIGGVTVEKSTIWKTLKGTDNEEGNKVLTFYECSVELPSDVKGVEYMDKSCGISYTVEAVQGNASTSDEDAVMVIAGEATESIEGKVSDDNKTTESITIASEDSVSVDVGSETQNLSVASVIVPEGTKVAEGATELSLSVYETEKPSNFGVTIEATQTSKTLEVKMEGLDASNDKILLVRAFIGKGLDNLTLYHNDGTTTMNKKSSVEDLSNDQDYYYDSATGFITIATASFSPFTYIFDAKIVNTAEELSLALADKSIKYIKLGKDIVVPSTDYNAYKRLNVETDGLTIDLCEKSLTISNCTLTIKGNNVTVTNGNMIASPSPSQTSGDYGSYAMQVKGKNTVISNIKMTGGVNVCGANSTNSEPDANVAITGCDITATLYYTVCAQDNSEVIIKSSTLRSGSTAFFWIEKKGYTERDEPGPVDSKLSYEKSTVTFIGNGPLYLSIGVAPIELNDEGYVTWAHDLYTLDKALNNEDIAVIKLNNNINLNKDLEINRSVTIDFCGKTIDTSNAFEINSGTLTFKDSADTKGQFISSNDKGISLINSNTAFELNDITIQCTNGDAISFEEYEKVENTTITMNSGKIIANDESAIRSGNDCGGKGHQIIINGGTIECTGAFSGIWLDNNCTLTINKCDYTAKNCRPIFLDCKSSWDDNNEESGVIINGINFVGTDIKVGQGKPDIEYVFYKDSSATGENVVIHAGTFSVEGNVTTYTTTTYPFKNN